MYTEVMIAKGKGEVYCSNSVHEPGERKDERRKVKEQRVGITSSGYVCKESRRVLG